MNKEMMQDSGVEWIGAIPQGWKWYRIKDVAELSPTYSADKPDSEMLCTVIPMECVSEKGIVDTSNVDKYGNISKGLTFFEKGDVIFAKITPCMENGKGAYIENLPTKYAFGSTEFHVLRTGYKLNGKFLYYYIFNDGFRDYAAVNMTGAAGQKRVSTNFLKYTPIYLPDISEQQVITRYLDQRCGKLDAIIAIKQQQIKTLDALRQSIIYQAVTKGLDDSVQLVDSGVEWLGKIPKGWKLLRLKSIADIRYGLGQPPATKDDGVPMVRATDISRGEITAEKMLTIDPDTLPLGRNPYLKEDEIIVVRSGAYTGDSAIIPAQYAGAVAGYDMVVTVNGANPKFIAYCLLNGYVLERQLRLLMLRAAQPHLNSQELGGILLILPKSTEEQKSIVAYLDQETQRLNDLKANLSQQIRTLEAYKKALIYECVTGKKRIKAGEPPASE